MSDLEQIRNRQDEVTNETLEATRRMLDMVGETEAVGIKTTEALHHQGEQLDNVERGLQKISHDLTDAEKKLKEMEKPFWHFVLFGCCGACNKKSNYNMQMQDQNDSNNLVQTPGKAKKVENVLANNASSSGERPQLPRLTNDAREDEMEKNLDVVGDILGNIRNMAVDMGTTIEKQNAQLDNINTLAQTNEIRVGAADTRTKELLKK